MDRKKLSDDILMKANEFTNWGFSMQMHEGAYLIGTSMDNEASGMKMHVVFDISEQGVAMSVFIPGCKYDEVKAAMIFQGLEFPVAVSGKSGQMFIARSNIAFDIMEKETDKFVEGLVLSVISMVKAMTDVVSK